MSRRGLTHDDVRTPWSHFRIWGRLKTAIDKGENMASYINHIKFLRLHGFGVIPNTLVDVILHKGCDNMKSAAIRYLIGPGRTRPRRMAEPIR